MKAGEIERFRFLLVISMGIALILALFKVFGHSRTNSNWREIAAMYDHGRKGIATVVDVSCVAVKADDIKESPTQNWKQFYSSKPLLYRIRYSFNPPDDSLSEALVHEVIVNHDPTSTLEPGKPLPILYSVSKVDNSHVASMPFPMPPKMLGAWNPDCFCTTVNGKKVNLQKK